MKSMELSQLTIHELNHKLNRKEISVSDVVRDVLKVIERKESELNVYISLFEEKALERALELEKHMPQTLPPLYGIPLGIKDNIVTKDMETTCGSRILLGYKPPYDATAVRRILDNGGIVIGKTNMDEFAMGSTGEYSYFGPTRNPVNTDYVPGGSSSGSAAAVASGEAIAALGSDTGGSVRLPAAFCGVVGFKPTYGTVSRYGLIAFASSLDQIGFLTKDVTDAAILYSVVGGFDPMDSTSWEYQVPDWREMLSGFDKLDFRVRIGVPEEFMVEEGVAKSILTRTEAFLKEAEKNGHKVVPVKLPHSRYAIETYYLIAMSEASSNLSRYDGVRYGYRAEGEEITDLDTMYRKTRTEGFGIEVKRRILVGTFALSSGYYEAYYETATKVRRLIKMDFEEVFKEVDVIVGPTSPMLPFKLGEKLSDPISIYLTDIFTVLANLTGIPAISLPNGVDSTLGLPIGLQVMGRPFDDPFLLKTAKNFEQILGN